MPKQGQHTVLLSSVWAGSGPGPGQVQTGPRPGPARLGTQGAAEVEGTGFFKSSLASLGLHVEGF